MKNIKDALRPSRESLSRSPADERDNTTFKSASVEHPLLEALFRFWSTKKAKLGQLPSRRDISPSEIKKLLPYIAIADVIDGGLDFSFRVCGTMISEGAGIELTGKTWSSFENTQHIIERTRILVEKAEPYYLTNQRATWAPKDFQHYSVLALPLARDGKSVDMVLYGVVYQPMERRD
ncbi:PAS domain-containing protein [Kordiimonas aestuarii]|uniref:PAS domain-containing protein n=1 Tax=Kordiimonas aestuarii TaxID=1005925 RepID=UPI0021D0EEA4|nr:PAS domain-containing protein [Kordiimonas aestuarii]